MKLFTLTDTNDGNDFSAWSAAIWAEDEAAAIAFVAENNLYNGGGTFSKAEYAQHLSVWSCASDALAHACAPQCAQEEQRPEVLRLAGWQEEGESPCNKCELFAMDLPEFFVCGVCGCCVDCGHNADCEEWLAQEK